MYGLVPQTDPLLRLPVQENEYLLPLFPRYRSALAFQLMDFLADEVREFLRFELLFWELVFVVFAPTTTKLVP